MRVVQREREYGKGWYMKRMGEDGTEREREYGKGWYMKRMG